MKNTQTKTGFTPGPWRHVTDFFLYREDEYNRIDAGIGYLNNEGDEHGFTISGCMSDADARLITAAPEMFELLQKGFEEPQPGDPGKWQDEVLKLFDKIRG